MRTHTLHTPHTFHGHELCSLNLFAWCCCSCCFRWIWARTRNCNCNYNLSCCLLQLPHLHDQLHMWSCFSISRKLKMSLCRIHFSAQLAAAAINYVLASYSDRNRIETQLTLSSLHSQFSSSGPWLWLWCGKCNINEIKVSISSSHPLRIEV